ncbi:MAG: restriction endonuclease subunit S [Nitrosomonas sp.]|uniref:restriction endonuclease subunit S n=1 Tax=Nitrosomonas sp. TaxID=42353 RepID=UPI0027304D2B|nr:restriction endonuclease subunit S [Nitrosomonas sp.]MDP1549228.1 restriction endonuclease subunit S [Nitrosomonas sp.]
MNATLGRMASFNKIKLGDAIILQRGFDITKSEQTEGEIPIVSSSGISSFHNQWKTKGPGVVIGRKGTLGTVHYLKGNFWPHDTTLWVKDFKGNNRRFTYFFLQTLHLENFDTGSSNPTLNRNHIHKIKIIFPKLDEQQKIAAILSAYDELIENNQRRIALLEKMAEEIYREWFVRLRFPGHEKVKKVKGVPEGWKLVKLEHAFKFTGGGTPTKEVNRYWDGGDVNWFTPSDITSANGIFLEQSGEQCTEEGLNNSSAKIFPAYSVMLTSRATIGAIGINLTPACTNQGFITCIPNAQYPLPYLYHWIKLAKPHFELLSGGATFAELTKGTFKRLEILTPPEFIITEFMWIESPLFNSIENYLRANRKLIETRDMLLPRLISGKLSVEHLDIQFPPGMEESACV